MVDSFNEDDDLKRLKDWWRQNGTALILGVGAGLAAIVGWQWWKGHVESQAYGAASGYEEFATALNGGSEQEALEQLGVLRENHAGSAYSARASLEMAARLVENESYDKAADILAEVADNAGDEALRFIARSRQARALWAGGDSDAAISLLNGEVPPAFASLYSEIRGDIHLAAGRKDQALSAYKSAMNNLPAGADPAPLQTKLESAGGSVDPAAVSIKEVS